MLTKIKTIILTLSFVLFFSINTFAQGQGIKLEEIDSYDERTFNCEIYSQAVDIMLTEYWELIGKSDFLVLIARLGRGETNRKLNLRRLHNVRARIEFRYIDPKKFVIAEGEKVSGLGRVEVYAGGKLIEVFPVNRNRDICVECCGFDDQYYPDRDELERKQKQKTKKKRRG